MSASHPLDNVTWSALTGRQASLAISRGGARRFHPAFGMFAAVADHSPASLADLGALVAETGDVVFLQADPPEGAPGVITAEQHLGVQMVAERLTPASPPPPYEILDLTDADAPEMLALATLTRPGPFFERTHELGDFVGVKVDGVLVAMAGERMRPDGHVEVSGVCAHPDHRGRGYAGALSRVVAGRILERGDIPFLHAFASNTTAVRLYESLGFRIRREVQMTWMTRAP